MKNAAELRNELAEVFAALKAGKIKHDDAAELAKIAGKMIKSAAEQLKYYAMLKDVPQITFLEDDRK